MKLTKWIGGYLAAWEGVDAWEIPTVVVAATEAWEMRPRYRNMN